MLGLTAFGTICVTRRWKWKSLIAGFVIVGAVFGGTTQILEAALYQSQAEWGLHEFYLVAAIGGAVVAALITIAAKSGNSNKSNSDEGSGL